MQSVPKSLTLKIGLNEDLSGHHSAIICDEANTKIDQESGSPHPTVKRLLSEFRSNHPNLCINNVIPTHQDPLQMGDTIKEILREKDYPEELFIH